MQEHLVRLLTTMARNKLTNATHKERAGRRDYRRVKTADADVAGKDASPSMQVETQELLREARRRLSPDEQRLLELRDQGQEWTEIAALLGGQPEALRKKLARAIDRVA